ncbi:MAG: type I methionyl aminopeptidase [Betaproteobacteria bacterium]|nr:type I methionyl aminopeptidase [Betaproteobacteria bacterium]
MSVAIKTPEEIEKMRVAGKLAAEVLDFVAPCVRPGVTTAELDYLCHDYMVNGDTSRMFYAGQPSIQARRLCEVTFECMWRGVLAVKPGAHLGDIGHAIQCWAEEHGCSVVREFCGHGIGQRFHEEPQVLHYGKPGTGLVLRPGMTFTIEPMINAGKPDVRQLADGWTVVTKDHSLSAQWEHTVLVTGTGCEVLTVSSGAPPMPQFRD